MKSPEQIVEYIDQWIANSLDRPQMYAASPEALEGTVFVLEELRSFVVEQESSGPFRLFPYPAYLEAHGFGCSTFTGASGNNTFEALVAFLRQYLISQNRPHQGGYRTMMDRTR
jgi:hypothetical protein